MQTVTSTDGTTIAYERRGSGRPLVLVHPTGFTRRSWRPLVPELAEEFSLVMLDRRGRGESGDAADYSLDREVADVRAVADAVDGDPVLFGHSYGGLLALEAARRSTDTPAVCYEPALLTEAERTEASLAREVQRLLDAGERREAVKTCFRESGGAENVEAWPNWPECVDLAETLPRELRAVERYAVPDEFEESFPALLLVGEAGPAHLRAGAEALRDALAEGRLVELDGLDHGGIQAAPERVAREVRVFLTG